MAELTCLGIGEFITNKHQSTIHCSELIQWGSNEMIGEGLWPWFSKLCWRGPKFWTPRILGRDLLQTYTPTLTSLGVELGKPISSPETWRLDSPCSIVFMTYHIEDWFRRLLDQQGQGQHTSFRGNILTGHLRESKLLSTRLEGVVDGASNFPKNFVGASPI